MDYSFYHQQIIYFVNLVCGLFSLVGSLFIILLFLKIKKLQSLPFRLIFYMSLSDFIHSIGIILPYFVSNEVCEAQGYILSYSSLSTIIWSACIAHGISKTVIFQENIQKYEKNYLFLGFCMPPVSYLALIYTNYTKTLGWC